MKIKVVKNGYYVSNDLTGLGMVDQGTFEFSFTHMLVVGDVWEAVLFNDSEYECYECIEGKWEGELSEGWWEYEGNEGYFEIIS